ncbi:LemA family protein [Paractinoplanes rhizophilus]|jgi:LemA protein|uniref:LemA family protein n=1 Tax=Paractinoplanes rhizophilus TaxID=1416877 RepID=A0ABW2HJ66_9ACTN|nr:LemA family protein [Actinoplanes sp.]
MTTVTAVAGGIVCLLLIVVVAVLVATYNRLVRLRNQADASWAQVDVQLKRRYDLIPNLVETVRGYAAHERGTLDAVVAARGNAMSAAQGAGPASRAVAEGELTSALGRLFAVAEAYPQLKANENFAALQAELSTTEDKIAYARQFFNSAIQSYNNAVQTVPTNIVAALTGFRAREFYQAAGDERGPVRVQF